MSAERPLADLTDEEKSDKMWAELFTNVEVHMATHAPIDLEKDKGWFADLARRCAPE